MPTAALIYPHQLYADQPALAGADRAYLVEDPLLFAQYAFHRQKLMLHRASMARYAAGLKLPVQTIEASQLKATGDIAAILKQAKVTQVRVVDPCDDHLTRRLTVALAKAKIEVTVLDDPHFLTPRSEIAAYAKLKPKLYFTDFYMRQRKRLGVLLEDDGKPRGGKWSFDAENRKRMPATVKPPAVKAVPENDAVREARAYVRANFPKALGDDGPFAYPTSHAEAKAWLKEFVKHRLGEFGDYEDAISTRETTLFHSVLTPMLNTGLLTPAEVVSAALARDGDVPMNSLEGFVRQVIGWREFVRLVYLTHGGKQRTTNFWGFTHAIPAAFYDGTTGIDPVDLVVENALKTGYSHHIERLMILGNFMLLCEIRPDAVFQWFMEIYIDAYDWVMVPNVYGMSQHADGGTMTTKPYISGSSYVLKMSDHKKGPWCTVWDALYWRFIDRQSDFFKKNQRMSVMVAMKDKLGDKMDEHRRVAEKFLTKLHAGT